MSLQSRIENTNTMRDAEGLVNDIVAAISNHFAIPKEDITKVLEDEV